MKGRSLSSALMMAVGLTACDKIPFIGGGSDTAAVDTTTQMAAPPTQPAPRQTPPTTRQAPPVSQVAAQAEEPWTPITGTVSPGMTREEVVQAWGAPVVERQAGQWTYMFFRNGCEVRCGTFDVVLFDGGQVVDAVVRTPAHTYTGVSSSPAGTPGMFTPPQRFSDPIGVD